MVYITYLWFILFMKLYEIVLPTLVGYIHHDVPHSSPSQPSQFSYRLGTSTQHCFTNIWLVVWNIWIIFRFSWEESSQLTNSYFSEGWVHHQPDMIWFMFHYCFTQHLPNIYPRFTQHLPKIYPTFTQDLPNIYPRFTQHLPMVFPKLCYELCVTSDFFLPRFLRFNSKVRKMPGPSDHAKTPGPGATDFNEAKRIQDLGVSENNG